MSARLGPRSRIKVVLIAAVVVLAVMTLGLMYWRSTGSTASVSPTAPAAVMGSDGLPSEIEGQRVYRLADKAEWETLSGGFLLAAYPGYFFGTCPITAWSTATPAPTAEEDLLAAGLPCYGAWLSETANSTANSVTVAPKRPSLATMFMTWGGHAAVWTIHTHDPEAAGCSAASQARCVDAVVVDSLVWPTVPTEADGEHVYGRTELGEMAAAGTLKNLPAGFMLGGVVTVENQAVIGASCADYGPEAEQLLLASCRPQVMIGGEPIAPGSDFNAVDGQIVVARAHVNDAIAAQCPADVRAACEQAIVIDSVVWTSNPYSAVPMAPSTVATTMQIHTTP